jgi:glucose-1-phosphate thymidylyltransferase
MKGVVLAGGRDSRLRPITPAMATHLIPGGHKPNLFDGLEGLAEAPVTEVGIVISPDTFGLRGRRTGGRRLDRAARRKA